MKNYSALISNQIIFLLIFSFALILIVKNNSGIFIYTFDDAYIHMAYCKHIVENGVWGITPYKFSATTSSILWTAVLAFLYLIFGVSDHIPLILNFLVSVFLIFIIYFFLKKFLENELLIFLILYAIILLSPFSLHTFSGMEHLLHTSISLIFIFYSIKILSREKAAEITSREKNILLVITFFLSAVRYEGLLLIGIVIFLFLLRKNYLFAILLLIASLIPPVTFGIYSLSQGSELLPNTVIVKSRLSGYLTVGFFNILVHVGSAFFQNKKLSLLLIIAIFLFIYLLRKKNFFNQINLFLFLFISMTFAQVFFGHINHYRYEVSLIIIGIVANAIAVYYLKKKIFQSEFGISYFYKKKLTAFFAIIIFAAISVTGVLYVKKTIIASRNIYDQQYQMAMFLKKFYAGENVAANDIGAINYFTDLNNLDLFGLGTLEVAKEISNLTYNTDAIERITKKNKIKIALAYDSWYKYFGGLPPSWIKVAEWSVDNNFILGDDTVSFYAVDPAEEDILRKRLMEFSHQLPAEVKISFK